ncbi:hypothetical protein K458DRAFT_478676 [Lentithecium fluviatile CBS 122367]|uniref:Uncharacterized protein n=1 Tax=Lentithecium fluviatile CBS 122367 TaxID=1168545 RepID=A0A6G1IX84_9PLEO|nr:hypothetical protein K458DRAFT_478676 [Lentithecium fluviatile CBS 122367]
MAEVVAPGSQDTTTPSHRALPHGKKRAADSSLESEQRLSKRFDLLNLVDHNGTRLYIPVAGSSDAAAATKQAPPPRPVASVTEWKRLRKPRSPPADDCMQVEETPHRVYIHDLAAELSDIESDEENPIFLPDIEKHLARIPKHVLVGPEPKATKDNQLVLYNVPSSLSVPEEKDNVRKAIVEARARLREQQANPVVEPERVIRREALADRSYIPIPTDDPDAMDID